MDSTTAQVLDSFTDNLVSTRSTEDDDNHSIDDDEFLDLLEEDGTGVLGALREQRMQELHSQMKEARRFYESGHGVLTEVNSEKEVMDITTSTKCTVVHFFHPSFKRCQIMTERLKTLTAKHMETRFISVNVDNATFLVVRLKIKVLPCVMAFIDGKEVLRLVGFEKLGNSDDFDPAMLEFQLQNCGVIKRKLGKLREGQSASSNTIGKRSGNDSEEDDFWD